MKIHRFPWVRLPSLKWPSFDDGAIVTFLLGICIAVPLAIFGPSYLADNVTTLVVLMIVVISLFGVVFYFIVLYRHKILRTIFRYTTTRLEDITENAFQLTDDIIEGKPLEAKKSLKQLLCNIAARYSWLKSRQWMLATMFGTLLIFTGLVGSALIFKQNKILTDQYEAFLKQNKLITDSLSYEHQRLNYQIIADQQSPSTLRGLAVGRFVLDIEKRGSSLVTEGRLDFTAQLKISGQFNLYLNEATIKGELVVELENGAGISIEKSYLEVKKLELRKGRIYIDGKTYLKSSVLITEHKDAKIFFDGTVVSWDAWAREGVSLNEDKSTVVLDSVSLRYASSFLKRNPALKGMLVLGTTGKVNETENPSVLRIWDKEEIEEIDTTRSTQVDGLLISKLLIRDLNYKQERKTQH